MRRILALAAVALLCAAPAATASGGKNDSRKLRERVTVKGIMAHEVALQGIATFSGGNNRLAGTPGYDSSALYVSHRAARAGLNVSSHEFDYELDLLADYKQPILRIVSGARRHSFNPGIVGAIPQAGGEFGTEYGSPSTDIVARVWAIDLNLDPGPTPNSNTSGCELSDYEGMPEGAIALVQRGTCSFAVKFDVARQSGAGAVVLFNEGNPGRTQPIEFFFDVSPYGKPMFNAAYHVGARLANGVEDGDTGVRARFRIDWRPGTYPTENVIAETRRGDPDNVIVVGAHLDSVGTGPGINDNGSGSSSNLEIAEQIARMKLRNKVRFVWFSAEESGLLGSEAYVASLPPAEREKIAAMLNFDMIGSPNFVRMVYDGDLSSSEPPECGAPAGSAEIEDIFLDYFARRGLPVEPTEFSGRSDYGPFLCIGVPAGGLFTGAEEVKTPEQAAIFGGTAGEWLDPCYHQGCDNIFNLSLRALDQMSDAAAHATITLAQARERPGSGVPAPAARSLRSAGGADVPGLPQPVAPSGN
jgi:Peptidase family M28/PA domain